MDSKLLPLLLAVALMLMGGFSSVATARSSWKYCGDSSEYKVSVRDVVVQPDPVIQGAEAVFEIHATTGETINGGELILAVSYFGIPVYKETDNLCEKMDSKKCPAGPGNFTLSNTQVLAAPIGSYRLEMKMLDDKQSLLGCVRISFRVVKSGLQVE